MRPPARARYPKAARRWVAAALSLLAALGGASGAAGATGVVHVQTAAGRVLSGDQQLVRDALGTIETVGRQTVDEMRRLLGILRQDEAPALPLPEWGLCRKGDAGTSRR